MKKKWFFERIFWSLGFISIIGAAILFFIQQKPTVDSVFLIFLALICLCLGIAVKNIK
jgi:hypothetical protein